MNITNIFGQLLTGKDNKTQDIARWSWMITTIVVIVGALWNGFNSNLFGLRDFAESIGIITGAHGAAVLMKRDSEPPPPPPTEPPKENNEKP
jgi:hypothetical protein